MNVYSSWDEYAAEVKSGRLEWSPVHRSDKFWVIGITIIMCIYESVVQYSTKLWMLCSVMYQCVVHVVILLQRENVMKLNENNHEILK